MTALPVRRRARADPSVFRWHFAVPAKFWRVWIGRIASRRALAGLHPEQLREVGLDPHAVRAEILKPFWQA
jgi:uncharacterized protein YjiS (DUF1127 family)